MDCGASGAGGSVGVRGSGGGVSVCWVEWSVSRRWENEVRMARRTEWVWHAEGVAVCFDEVAAFDVGLEVEVGD